MTTLATSVSIGKKPDPVTLTDFAATKVAELLAQEEGDALALRVAVKSGGCSGYSYEMFFDAEVADDDIIREFSSVRVVVDPASACLLYTSHPAGSACALGPADPDPVSYTHLDVYKRQDQHRAAAALPLGAAAVFDRVTTEVLSERIEEVG